MKFRAYFFMQKYSHKKVKAGGTMNAKIDDVIDRLCAKPEISSLPLCKQCDVLSAVRQVLREMEDDYATLSDGTELRL